MQRIILLSSAMLLIAVGGLAVAQERLPQHSGYGTGDVSLQVMEDISARQPFGIGKKLVREVIVLRVNETLAGYGGLGQRPDPRTERGIISTDASTNGWILGQVQQGGSEIGHYECNR